MDRDRSIKKWKTIGRALAWVRLILTVFALLYDITSNKLNNRIIVIGESKMRIKFHEIYNSSKLFSFIL